MDWHSLLVPGGASGPDGSGRAPGGDGSRPEDWGLRFGLGLALVGAYLWFVSRYRLVGIALSRGDPFYVRLEGTRSGFVYFGLATVAFGVLAGSSYPLTGADLRDDYRRRLAANLALPSAVALVVLGLTVAFVPVGNLVAAGQFVAAGARALLTVVGLVLVVVLGAGSPILLLLAWTWLPAAAGVYVGSVPGLVGRALLRKRR